MTTAQIFSLFVSAGLIGMIIWWFFGKKSRKQASRVLGSFQSAEIIVQGGYKPEVTVLRAGLPATLTFLRKDASSCLEDVILPDFGIQKKLTIGKSEEIELGPVQSGEYEFSCGMRMYHGKIVVK